MAQAAKPARRNSAVTKAHGGDHARCVAVREVLKLVGDKWSVLLVGVLGNGPLRFSEIKRTIEGISQRMLTLTLRGLERDGLLTRTVTPTIPPRVDYELTVLGLTLLDPVRALAKWAERHRTAIQTARDRFDEKTARPAATGLKGRSAAS
ncbi:MAG TPA: helix-turn-helix domain-containing protein [Polyangia bacterium]|jgi:DNA-binding HxlR family transcriptional regulator